MEVQNEKKSSKQPTATLVAILGFIMGIIGLIVSSIIVSIIDDFFVEDYDGNSPLYFASFIFLIISFMFLFQFIKNRSKYLKLSILYIIFYAIGFVSIIIFIIKGARINLMM